MTNRQMTHQYRLSQWTQVMRGRRESGLSVRAWCAENKINEKTYYYWQNKLRTVAREQINEQAPQEKELIPNGWTQIRAIAPVAPADESLTIEIGAGRIKVNANTSAELLSKACRVLVELC